MRVYSARDIFVDESVQRPAGYSRSNSTHSNTESNMDMPLDSVEAEVPVRKFITVDICDSDSDAVKRNCVEDDDDDDYDEDDDVDDGIGSSLDVKICSGKESASSSAIVDLIESGDEDIDDMHGRLTQVVSHKTASSSSSNSTVVEIKSDNSDKKLKKRIIPNEISIRSPSVSPQPTPSSVIDVEEEPKSTLVDMAKLTNDVVIDLEPEGTNTATEKSSGNVPENRKSDDGSPKKKKVIPFEVNKLESNMDNSFLPISVQEGNHSNSNEDKISLPQLAINNVNIRDRSDKQYLTGNDKNAREDFEDDISNEVESSRIPSSSSELSPHPKDLGSTPTASSRPETPIWDYYDFACDETPEASKETQGESATDNNNSTDSQSTKNSDETQSSKSTLQESLARLSRPSVTLDTCRVAGPVLPAVVLDDFEMDDD